MSLYEFLLYLSVADFSFGGYVLAKNPRSRQNLFFGLLCFGIGFWVLGFCAMHYTRTFYWPDKVLLAGGILIAGSLFAWTRVFPNTLDSYKEASRSRKVLQLLPLAILLVLLPFNLFVKNVIFEEHGIRPLNGPLFTVYALILSIYVLLALKNFYLQLRSSTGYKRQRVLYVLFGLTLFLICALIFDLILPIFGLAALKIAGPLASFFFIACSAASLISYKLMDIRLLVGTVVVNFLSAIAAGVFVLVSSLRFRHDIDSPMFVLLCFGAILIFLACQHYLQKGYRGLFLKNYLGFEQIINRLNAKLRQELSPKNIITLVNEHLRGALLLRWCCFYDYGIQKFSGLPFSASKNFDSEYFSSKQFRALASDLVQPHFFTDSAEEEEPAVGQRLTALLPLADNENSRGYFLLGPQAGLFTGLSAEQIEKLQSCWLHIQTAYARAVLHQNQENRINSQVETIIQKNRRLREEIQNRFDFVKAISHQLRTPATVLSGALQLLGKEPDQETRRELIGMAYEKSKHLGKVISGILNLAKVEQGNIEASQEAVELNQIFADILPVLEPLAAAKGLKIEYELRSGLKVFGSKQYLEQVFANLLENAVNFTAQGGIKIYFMLEPEYIITCIKDTGTGIAEELRPKIFKKNTHGPGSPGVGLGLYLVKSIINAHPKGHVWFESDSGGTTFFVRLQRAG